MEVYNSIVLLFFRAIGFNPKKSSFSYFLTLLYLIFSIVNLVSSVLFFDFASFGDNLSALLLKVNFYFSLTSHVVFVSRAMIKCGAEAQLFSKLSEMDEFMLKSFGFKVKCSNSSKIQFCFKTILGCLIPIVLNIFTVMSVLEFGTYAELWLRVLPGRLSAQLKCIHILFYLEILQQKFLVLDLILTKIRLQLLKDI